MFYCDCTLFVHSLTLLSSPPFLLSLLTTEWDNIGNYSLQRGPESRKLTSLTRTSLPFVVPPSCVNWLIIWSQ